MNSSAENRKVLPLRIAEDVLSAGQSKPCQNGCTDCPCRRKPTQAMNQEAACKQGEHDDN